MTVARFMLAVLVFCPTFIPSLALAETYPTKSVKIMVGFAPGGGNDRIARMIAPKLSERWGHPVVVENMEGADATIAADVVAKSRPDGHTLLLMNTNQATTPALRKLPFDAVKDFTYITIIAAAPEVLMSHPEFPAKTVKELITLAKSDPGNIQFGSTGTGGPNFIEMAKLMKEADIKMTAIPYKGGGAALPALLGGEIKLMFQNTLVAQGSLSGKQLRALAITGAKRSAALPDVPTFREAADLTTLDDIVSWYGVAGPAGLSPDVISKIYRDVVHVMKIPEITNAMTAGGFELILSAPDEATKQLARDIADYSQIMKQFSK